MFISPVFLKKGIKLNIMKKKTHLYFYPLAVTLAMSGLFSSPLRAQDVQDAADAWHFTVGPSFSGSSFKGNGAIGPLSGKMKMPFHQVASDTRFAFSGGFIVSKGPVGFWLDGQYLDLSQSITLDGGMGKGSLKGNATQLSAGMWYQMWEKPMGGKTVHGTPQMLTVSPLAGVRWTRLKATAEADGYSASQKNSWAIPYVGGRGTIDLNERWLVTAEADIGGWGQDFTTQGQAYLGYRLGLFGIPAVAHIGYQVQHQDHKESDLHWNMTQFGPVAALTFTF